MHLGAAFKWFFKVLSEGEPVTSVPAAPVSPPVFTPSTEPAIQLLGLLQKDGRLVDFLMEDIGGFSDAEVGAAAREIHTKCRKALGEAVTLEPILKGAEGDTVTIPGGFDPSAIALTGNVVGAGPFKGTLRHRGWRVSAVKLPTVPPAADAKVAHPAEVEV